MQQTIQITIRDIPPSPALYQHIKKKTQKLETYFPRIQSCRVVIEQLQKHQGKLYRARLDIAVPGCELVINKHLDEDVYVAVRDAFAAAARLLKSKAERQHGATKNHPEVTHGHIKRLFVAQGYGFIESLDQHEYYFNFANIAYPEFSQLAEGMSVQFIPTVGIQGLQANRISIGKHGNHSWEQTH